jgi:hypothetical protein
VGGAFEERVKAGTKPLRANDAVEEAREAKYENDGDDA